MAVCPPVYAGILPNAASAQGKIMSACRDAAAIVAHKGNAALLDLRRKEPATEEVANFWDDTHYRHALARLIEFAVADVLAGKPVRPEVALRADPALVSR